MSNFIIKPDGLFPSTYSQMGRVLIPSKDCNNRKIARKYTEKGATTILDTQTGMKTISTPYISTFKRFDRSSPLISLDCQNCQIVSVPSVTDKTIYPCSLNKYSVTGYTDAKNKIGVLGNSMYPRITTGDYQLYQQYRVTDKNNIITPPPNSFIMLIDSNSSPIISNLVLPFYLGAGSFVDAGSTRLTVQDANNLVSGSVKVIIENNMYNVQISADLLNYDDGNTVNFFGDTSYAPFNDSNAKILNWGVAKCGYLDATNNKSLTYFKRTLP